MLIKIKIHLLYLCSIKFEVCLSQSTQFYTSIHLYCIHYLLGSMHSLRLTILGPMAPLGFFSQPTHFGHAKKSKQTKQALTV